MEENKPGIIKKILKASDVWLENYIETTKSSIEDRIMQKAKSMANDQFYRRSLYLPPQYQFQGSGFREKTTRIGYNTLRMISYKDSIIASVIQTRLNQVAAFSRPQKDKFSPGFCIEFKDKNKEIKDEDKQVLVDMAEYISNCGIMEDKPRTEYCSFDTFLRRITRDRLTYDQVAVEKIFDRKDSIHHFVPVDAATIRFASAATKTTQFPVNWPISFDEGTNQNVGENVVSSTPTKGETKPEEPDYVQVVDGRIKRAFTANELSFRFGNPVNDIYANGYSIGELELLIGIITSHIHAENYNKLFFTQGHVNKGILHLETNIPQHKLEDFKEQFYAQTSGNINSWRTPIMASQDKINWINLTQSQRDMEFHAWMEYLIKVTCAIYQIAPNEINFDITKSSVSGNSSLFESGNEKRLKHSQDKGLRPLLRFIEDIINEDIIDKINNNLRLRFVGLDAETQDKEVDRHNKEVRAYKTIDEVRAENDLGPLGEEKGGHLILDPSYLQWTIQFGPSEMNISKDRQMDMMFQQQQFGEGDEQDNERESKDNEQELKDNQQENKKDNNEKESKDDKIKKSLKKSNTTKLLKVEYWRK